MNPQLRNFAGLTLAMVLALPAYAQDAKNPDTAAARDEADPYEILVTAQKREETLQQVPISVSAIGAEQLRVLNAQNITDYYRQVPGLNVQSSGGVQRYSLRGISTSTNSLTTQSTVAVLFDDFPAFGSVGSTLSPDLDLFDVARVEVLRGPQGTLFGSGALAGAIRIITNKPDLENTSSQVEYQGAFQSDGDPRWSTKAALNLPIVPGKFGVRMALIYREDGGWVDNANTGKNTNSGSVLNARMLARWKPNDRLTLDGTIMLQRQESDDSSFTYLNRPTPTTLNYERKFGSLVPETVTNRFLVFNGVLAYDLDWATASISATYGETTANAIFDASGFTQLVGVITGIPGTAGVATPGYVPDDGKTRTVEVRLTSNASESPLSYSGGLYYLDRSRDYATTVRQSLFEPILGTDALIVSTAPTEDEELAAFGTLTYRITDRLSATAGLRVTRFETTRYLTTAGLVIGNGGSVVRTVSDTAYTPRFVLEYQATDDAMFYLSASQGFRLGGANGPAVSDPLDTFASDSLWNYEIGAKTQLFDRRLTFNISAYYVDWQDIQVSLRRLGLGYTGNGGAAESYGLEVEARARLENGLDLSTAISINNAVLAEDIEGLVQSTGTLGAKKGDRLPGAARFTIANNIQYALPINLGEESFIRAEHQYTSGSFSDFDQNTAGPIGDYHTVNLRAGVSFERVSVALFAENLLDGNGITNSIINYTPFSRPIALRIRPRTIGMNVRYQF